MEKIRIGICGYGNLGRGVESEIAKNPDMELAAVFTRRDVSKVAHAGAGVSSMRNLSRGELSEGAGGDACLVTQTTDATAAAAAPVVSIGEIASWKDKIDVLILCGGSKSDLPTQGPLYAKDFNTVDSFDTHAKIPEHFEAVDAAAKAAGHISIISAGWDPGLFSLMRLYMGAVAPEGATYTFWGPGVSQGHSEAIRGIEGVAGAIQYTIPNEGALERIRGGETPELTTGEKHTRLCYVAAKDGADKAKIETEIKTMPNYFADYDTTVNFVTLEELSKNHSKMKHGGHVLRTGKTGEGNNQSIEFTLKLDSNPEFTSSVLIACARAAYRLSQKGESGAKTIFDIPPAMLSQITPEKLRKELL